ncbi:NUDIX hydrolase [Shimazuella kribbensis]|uniref:NUDIX hydrolase n=1 Tax=Shimazuella kribbensis TaxID=139808 RepID=UPI00048B952F|nr:NUDIX hydrolase [Shimazuella kribbensis]
MTFCSTKPRKVAKVVIIDTSSLEWKVLILQRVARDIRPISPHGHDFPGGHVRLGEMKNPRLGAIREVREETDLVVAMNALMTLSIEPLSDGSGNIYWYLAEFPGGEVRIQPREHDFFFWKEIGSLTPNELTPSGWMENLIRMGVEKLEKRFTS